MADGPRGGETLDARIKRCIREELNSSRLPNTTQTLVGRTRDLIRSASSVAAGQLGAISPQLSTVSPTPREASHASHPLRFKKKVPPSKAKKSKQIFPKSVYLLDDVYEEGEIEHGEDYVLKEEMVLIKGEFDLESEANEQMIRSELKKVFSKKFPLINNTDFDFVKRDRNTISTPVVKDDHKWDCAHVKHLCGSGKLYVRLNVSKETIIENNGDSDDSLERSVFDQPSTSGQSLSTVPTSSNTVASTSGTSTSTYVPVASTSNTASSTSGADSKIATLRSLFPNAKACDIHYAVVRYYDLDAAANYLSELIQQQNNALSTQDDEPYLVDDSPSSELETAALQPTSDNEESKDLSATQILEKLKSKMKPVAAAEKVKIEREDLLMDVLQIYKDPNFDPTVPLRFQIKGEPAVDTGGVRRQVYEELFLDLIKGEQGFQMFKGPIERVLPIYRSTHIIGGVFELLGKMIAHSLAQGGPGFPHLAPVLYWYIATGDLQQALTRTSCVDIVEPSLKHYIMKIRDATPVELAMIRNEEEFIEIMQSCGETRLLSENNKLEVVQNLVMHEVLIKHQTSLNQLSKGLSTLGLLDEIKRSPEKFEPYFVHKDKEVSKEFVRELLTLPESEKREIKNVVEMLLSFLDNADKKVLGNFLRFCTGCKSSTAALKPGCIKVNVENTPSIYASTCVLKLILPTNFISLDHFQSSLCAVINDSSFSTV